MRRVGRGDDDVGPLELRRQLVKADGDTAEAVSEPDRAVVAAVGDEHGLDTLGRQRPSGQLSSLAGADQEHATGVQAACQRTLRELDRGRWDRGATLADPGLGPDSLARSEGAAE